eukprot:88597-Rhodomonas_salina.1
MTIKDAKPYNNFNLRWDHHRTVTRPNISKSQNGKKNLQHPMKHTRNKSGRPSRLFEPTDLTQSDSASHAQAMQGSDTRA